jgi:hypothetical protein
MVIPPPVVAIVGSSVEKAYSVREADAGTDATGEILVSAAAEGCSERLAAGRQVGAA